MATPQNTYLLDLAKSAESVALSERGILLYPHNHTEVLASILQALLMTLGGGQPTSTAMPPEIGQIGLNDLVQVKSQRPNLTWQEFVPFFPFGQPQGANVASVPADGTVTTITYTNHSLVAFPNTTNLVLALVKNNYAANPWLLTIQSNNYTATGFDIAIAGGPPSSTVSLDFVAFGQ